MYDYTYQAQRGAVHKLVFVSWAPDTAPVKAKMVYASTKEHLKTFLDGVSAEVSGSDLTDIDEASVEERVRSGLTRA